MFIKIKDKIAKLDLLLFKIFGSYKSVKCLENIKEARIIFSLLNENNEQNNVRFVGGCVRKALNGENIDDIDLATTLKPDQVRIKLSNKDIKVIDTGLTHGTVTAILNDKKFEITTLREDVSTDGRHAKVAFTSNWENDASRRDFTINSIYADLEGRTFDPLNGISDLRNGRIRFIGSPEERIQEDYLRILRYFRFFLQYSSLDHDQDVLKYIKKNINGLNKISKERIFIEIRKILNLKNATKLFLEGPSKEIMLNLFPQFKYSKRLNKLSSLDEDLRNKYDEYLILALLIVDETDNYEYFCHKYKLSNSVRDRLKSISKSFENLKNKKYFSEANIRKLIYFSSKEQVKDLIFFSICVDDKNKIYQMKELLKYVNTCKVPKFPISGNYLKEHGYEAGKILGKKLKLLEEKWIENNFTIDQKIIDKSLGKTKYT